jgi:pimeloyl-ACP methyl ester carboxylesterase
MATRPRRPKRGVPAERWLDIGGQPTRVLEAGSGEPILWLHDTLGNRWTPGHELLSRSHSMVAPSLPGFDDSSTLTDFDEPDDVVFWLREFLDALLERPVLLGAGLGGWMAAEFAVRYPDQIQRLVLVDAYGLRVEGALAEDEFALPPASLRPLLFTAPEGPLACELVPDQPPPEGSEAALHARVAAARFAWQFPYNRKLRQRLRRATLPALIIWGEHDRLVPVAHAHAFAEALPDARAVILPGAAHYPYLERPRAFARLVQTFIRP